MICFNVHTGSRNLNIKIPVKNYLYYAEPKYNLTEIPEEKIICESLDNPIGCDPLDSIKKNSRVVIIIDDCTRPTPTSKIIPHVIKRIQNKTNNIAFITAPGTHRKLTRKELIDKIGQEYLNKFELFNIHYKEKDSYNYIGQSELNTPLYIHKSVIEADFRIVIGNINIHNVVGWSGGAKMLHPGVSGEKTTSFTHLKGATNYDLIEVIGNINTPMRKEVDDIGKIVGLEFIINTVLDMEGNILGLFSGHYIEAHRAGVSFAQKILRPKIPSLADIVIVSAYPSNADYWQGLKPLAFSMFGVKKNGTIIFLFDPKEGLCGNSPTHKKTLKQYLPTSKEQIIESINNNEIDDIVGISNPLCHFQILEHTHNILCVTNSLSNTDCELLRFKRFTSINDAIEKAFELEGQNATIGIIPFGAETLVQVKK